MTDEDVGGDGGREVRMVDFLPSRTFLNQMGFSDNGFMVIISFLIADISY